MFPWVALWPLVGLRLMHNQIEEAIEYVRALLAPVSQPPPAELATILEAIIQAWDQDEPEKALAQFNQVVELAQQTGYL